MLAANDNFLYLKVPLKLMLWSHMPVCYYKFDITHESVFSSPSLLNEYLRYHKLWGPSQRVVTLFLLGGGDGHHLQKNIEQYICFREQLIKEHVKRLYQFEF